MANPGRKLAPDERDDEEGDGTEADGQRDEGHRVDEGEPDDENCKRQADQNGDPDFPLGRVRLTLRRELIPVQYAHSRVRDRHFPGGGAANACST